MSWCVFTIDWTLKLLPGIFKYLKRWRQRRKEAKAKEFHLPRERCYTKEERKAIEDRAKEIAAEIEAQLNKERKEAK